MRRGWRRHHPGANLQHDLFPGLRIGGDIGKIDRVQREAGDLVIRVMAIDAILIDNRLPCISLARRQRKVSADSPLRRKPDARMAKV